MRIRYTLRARSDLQSMIDVIPGRRAAANPESSLSLLDVDSGFAGLRPRPGMTTENLRVVTQARLSSL
jgi:hypothetical protein